MGAVLVIAPHPDDETLGCGGTLLKHVGQGDDVYWVVVTHAWEPKYSSETVRRQVKQVEAVAAAYPFSQTVNLEFKTTRLDEAPMNGPIDRLREVLQKVRPEVVYVPSPFDAHSDHRIVFDAAMAVMRPFYMKSLGIRRILACEIPFETDAGAPVFQAGFVPQVFSDISGTMERKLAIMKLFDSEIQPEPLPRSLSAIRALARHRGATAGLEYAEAFMLVREIC